MKTASESGSSLRITLAPVVAFFAFAACNDAEDWEDKDTGDSRHKKVIDAGYDKSLH
ncbi:hypothetical protein [Undibacterium sp.]|uniref:hypothetical protein n=1 Tax=Undibacterium sp. TaxID=1914977 RepID=UPI002731AD6A|nr:hypothetical protein [Undibacterium sp.]MDP1978601.1 hypothetical protein [Undibacterium sp.]